MQDHEILGTADENRDCQPQAKFCDNHWNTTICTANSDCNEEDSVICDGAYTNCFYCEESQCLPGCSDNQNCPGQLPLCNAEHRCQAGLGYPGITRISVTTETCAGCQYGLVEDGLVLSLEGRYGSECRTDNLDNVLHYDYHNNHQADFLSQVTSESQDMGLGGATV